MWGGNTRKIKYQHLQYLMRSLGGESGTLTQRTTNSKNHYKIRLFATAGGGCVPPVCTTYWPKKRTFFERKEHFCLRSLHSTEANSA